MSMKKFNIQTVPVTKLTLMDLTWIEKDTKSMQACWRGVFRKIF